MDTNRAPNVIHFENPKVGREGGLSGEVPQPSDAWRRVWITISRGKAEPRGFKHPCVVLNESDSRKRSPFGQKPARNLELDRLASPMHLSIRQNRNPKSMVLCQYD